MLIDFGPHPPCPIALAARGPATELHWLCLEQAQAAEAEAAALRSRAQALTFLSPLLSIEGGAYSQLSLDDVAQQLHSSTQLGASRGSNDRFAQPCQNYIREPFTRAGFPVLFASGCGPGGDAAAAAGPRVGVCFSFPRVERLSLAPWTALSRLPQTAPSRFCDPPRSLRELERDPI